MALLPCPEGVTVERVRLYALRLPLTRPMHMAGSVIRETENLLVRIDASDGSVGWGEAASAPTMTGELLPGMAAAAQRVAAMCVGRPLAALDDAERRVALALHGNTSVKSAFETAWLDAAGRSSGRSVSALLGATVAAATTVDVQWMLGSGDAAADVAEARERHAAGFRVFKVKVGGSPAADAERTRAVVEALGDGCLVSADANQGWTVDAALAYVERVGTGCIAFLEQPVPAEDLDGMAEVARRGGLPICADEGIHSLRDIEYHRSRAAAGGASLKPIKLGGLRATVAAARRCSALGLEVNLACKVAESGVSAAALLHVAAASPSMAWGLSLSTVYLARELASGVTIGATAAVPQSAGLGIEVDPDILSRFATPL